MTKDSKLGFFALTGLVVGSMIGGGVFNLPSNMAYSASAGAIIIGWIITGIGIISLALTFQNLITKRPDLDGGIFAYAKEGFGNFIGFNSAWGYWVSAWLGNIALLTLLFSSLGHFIPLFQDGQNISSIIGASILVWTVYFLINRGVKSAAIINLITTIGKVIPLIVSIIILILAFNMDLFLSDFWGSQQAFSWSHVLPQVRGTMLVSLWVFVGIEGAVIVSSRAKNRKDVGKATVFGLLGTLIIYVLISLMSLGILSQEELAVLQRPSLVFVLQEVAGPWGAIFINLGLVISIMGAYLGWTILTCEIPYLATKDNIFPTWFGKESKNNVPTNALLITSILIQIFLLTIIISDRPYEFTLALASSAILIPYAFSAFYQVKYSLTTKGKDRFKNVVLGVIASLYAIWLVYAADLRYLMFTTLLYTPGILIFVKVQKENNQVIFTFKEKIIAILLILCAFITILIV